MPDDASFAAFYMLLSGLNAEVLVMAAGLFSAGVEHNEVVNDFQESGFIAQQAEMPIEGAIEGVVNLFFPLQVVFFRGFNRAIS